MKKSGTQQAKKPSGNWRAEDFVTPAANVTVVNEVKEAFDLFDTDQGGSIDTGGKSLRDKRRNQGRHGLSRFRSKESNHFPDDR